MKSASHIKLLVLTLLCAMAAGVLATGCGSGEEEAPPPPDYAKELTGSPAPLAALHEQSDQLLDGGLDAYNQRIEGLKGFPVVVNVWASWCGPCRAEFPYFQKLSAEMGKKVAFLGVNSQDDDAAAETFLSTHSVPYPSYVDHDKEIATDLGANFGLPATAFYDEKGEMTYIKHGEFRDQAELEEAIRQHAINGG